MTSDPAEEALIEAGRAKATSDARHRARSWKREKEIGDGWLGELAVSDEVPPIDQVNRIYLLAGFKDRMVVVRPQGGDLLELPALTVDAAARDGARKGAPSNQLERWFKPICKGQWGMHLKEWYQHSRFEMRPTPENTDIDRDARRFDLFLCATATRLDDLPEGSPWARRTVTTRDMVKLIRERYTEFDVVLNAAHEDYVVRRAKAAQGG